MAAKFSVFGGTAGLRQAVYFAVSPVLKEALQNRDADIPESVRDSAIAYGEITLMRLCNIGKRRSG